MSATTLVLTAEQAPYLSSVLHVDDRQAVARGLRERDPELLDYLVEQYKFRLYRYLLYITANKERAEDFFQETWIRVLERGHQYDGKSKFESWLFTIARNMVIDWQRQKKMQSLDSLMEPEHGAPLELVNEDEPSPLSQILSQEQSVMMQHSLGQIAAYYREVLLLRFQEELQIEEIAAVMNTSASTVKSRLYRGLAALRTALPQGVV